MKNAANNLLAWAEAQILMERMQMQCPVERDERQHNNGMNEQYWDELEERAAEKADENMHFHDSVIDASDYPDFFNHLTLALTADNNEERLRWLSTIRDSVHARIKSAAREELRKADLAGEEP